MDDAHLGNQLLVLFNRERLRAVAEGAFGMVVHLDDEAVGPDGDFSPWADAEKLKADALRSSASASLVFNSCLLPNFFVRKSPLTAKNNGRI